jgi:hypothetical protein
MTLEGDPGGSNVFVPLVIHTNSIVQAFTVDLELPPLVTLVSVSRGNLTQAWSFFNATIAADGSSAVIGGFTSGQGPIMSGTEGSLAVLNVTVQQGGCGSYGLTNLTGHIVNYEVCATSPVPVAPFSWGRLKSLYLE